MYETEAMPLEFVTAVWVEAWKVNRTVLPETGAEEIPLISVALAAKLAPVLTVTGPAVK